VVRQRHIAPAEFQDFGFVDSYRAEFMYVAREIVFKVASSAGWAKTELFIIYFTDD